MVGFSFSAHPDKARSAQLSIFGPAALSPERLATTLARLFALIGPGRVGSARTTDGHRPERFTMTDFSPPPPPKIRPKAPDARGLLSVRVLRPAREVRVETRLNGSRDPSPVFLETVENSKPRKAVQGQVRIASGPWELEESWWTDSPIRREYWDVEMKGGGIFRVYRDRETHRWYVDGIYD